MEMADRQTPVAFAERVEVRESAGLRLAPDLPERYRDLEARERNAAAGPTLVSLERSGRARQPLGRVPRAPS